MEKHSGNDRLWSFSESVVFTALLIVFGFGIELLTGASGLEIPSWPLNAVVLALGCAVIIPAGIFLRNNRYIAWLGGIPLGLCLIFGLAFLSFFGGILPQEPAVGSWWVRHLRLNQVFSSWPFALTVLFFLVNLGLSLVWKTVPFRSSNLQFILFHAGFWIALACGLLGASDLQRVIIPLYEGQETSRGYNSREKTMVDLPFSLYLDDFEMQEYAPQLALYDPATELLVPDESNAVLQASEGLEMSWPGLTVRVLDYLPHGRPGSDGVPVASAPEDGVAYVSVEGTVDGERFSGWLGTGGPHVEPAFIAVGTRVLVLIPGSASSYRSEVSIRGRDAGTVDTVLEVNRPVSVNGWKLYQMGYDEQAGRWSRLSLVEGVRDPWLPAVYTGFFMILAGNALFFWKGMKKSRVL